jgi:hypothetical protein
MNSTESRDVQRISRSAVDANESAEEHVKNSSVQSTALLQTF